MALLTYLLWVRCEGPHAAPTVLQGGKAESLCWFLSHILLQSACAFCFIELTFKDDKCYKVCFKNLFILFFFFLKALDIIHFNCFVVVKTALQEKSFVKASVISRQVSSCCLDLLKGQIPHHKLSHLIPLGAHRAITDLASVVERQTISSFALISTGHFVKCK